MPRKKPTAAPSVEPVVITSVSPSPLADPMAGELSRYHVAALQWLDGGASPLVRPDDADPWGSAGHYLSIRRAAARELFRRIAAEVYQVERDRLAPSMDFYLGLATLRVDQAVLYGVEAMVHPGAAREDVAVVEQLGRLRASWIACIRDTLRRWWTQDATLSTPLPLPNASVRAVLDTSPDELAAVLLELGARARVDTATAREEIARDGVHAWRADWDVVGEADGSDADEEPDLVRAAEAVRDGRACVLPTIAAILAVLAQHVVTFADAMDAAEEAAARVRIPEAEVLAGVARVAPRWTYREPTARERLHLLGLAAIEWAGARDARERERQAQDELKTVKAERDAAASEAERERRARKRLERRAKAAGLTPPSRITLPSALLFGGYTTRRPATVAKQIRRGRLVAHEKTDPDVLAFWQDAEVTTSPAELARLSVGEIRAFVVACQLFSTIRHEDGKLVGDAVEVPAAFIWELAGATDHQAKVRVFTGLAQLTRRTVPIAMQQGDAVLGLRVPLVAMAPAWLPTDDGRRRVTEVDARSIARAWTSWNPDTPWSKALPSRFRIDVPPALRSLFKPMLLSADVLPRLDAGAKAVRGAAKGFTGVDWFLVVSVLLGIQRGWLSEQGDGRVLSYVTPDLVLKDLHGAEKLSRWRSEGNYKRLARGEYEKAVRVLEAGDIARREASDHQAADGGPPRDVFAINPDVFLGKTPHRKAKVAPLAPMLPGLEDEDE